jgi:iron complex transport system permease protein
VIAGSLIAIVALALISLAVGVSNIPLSTVIDSFTDFDPTQFDHVAIRDSRAPRTLLAIVVGAGLSVAGALSQTLTRNPLGSPDILGVNSGAAFAVVLALFVGGVSNRWTLSVVAMLGALVVSISVAALAFAARGRLTPVRLVLSGIIITALVDACSSFILVSGERVLLYSRSWLVGSLAGRSMSTAVVCLIGVLPCLLMSVAMARQLNLLVLGDDVAAALGVRTHALRSRCMVLTVLLCGICVAAAGPIGFVALGVPHLVRRMSGGDFRWFLPLCMVVGATLLLAADVVGRIVVRPAELEVGVVTAIVGAPLLLALARRLSLGSSSS